MNNEPPRWLQVTITVLYCAMLILILTPDWKLKLWRMKLAHYLSKSASNHGTDSGDLSPEKQKIMDEFRKQLSEWNLG